MSLRRAPIALRMPISRVRSVTVTSMMFITPMPPTSSEIAATAASRTVKVWFDALVVCSSADWLRMLNAARAVGVRVVRREDRGRLGVGVVDRLRRRRLEHDLAQLAALADEQVLRRRQRDDHDVVLVLDAVRALRLEHALDLERRAVELDRLAERVGGRAEEVLDDGGPDHGDARVLPLVRGGDERALGDGLLARLGVGRSRPDHLARASRSRRRGWR